MGFGGHLPERDALYAALLLIEALVEGGQPLGARVDALQQRCGGAAAYDRLDLRLPDMATRQRLEQFLAATPPAEVAGEPVQQVITTDGVKLRLGVQPQIRQQGAEFAQLAGVAAGDHQHGWGRHQIASASWRAQASTAATRASLGASQ